MSGQVDYLLRVAVPDIASYDRFYKAFISQIDLTDVEFELRDGANQVHDGVAAFVCGQRRRQASSAGLTA